MSSGRRKSTRKTPNKRKQPEEASEAASEQNGEHNQEEQNNHDMVLVSRKELDTLRAIKMEWEKSEPLLKKQPELLQTLQSRTETAVTARESENKQLKQEVAHYKAASEQATEQAASQREVLRLLEALTNATFREENGRFLCTALDLDLAPAASFYLAVDDAGAVHYDPVSLAASAPAFFHDSIVFSRGQAVIFFREVLKLLSREK